MLVGGIDGAAVRGYEMTGWCEAANGEVLRHINETLPEGASLRVLAFHDQALDLAQGWGGLRPDLRIGVPLEEADYHLVQNRRGFFGVEEIFLFDHWIPERSRRFGWPRWETVPDVPLIVVAETGEPFREALRRAVTPMPTEGTSP
jgi:hypothetical protein